MADYQTTQYFVIRKDKSYQDLDAVILDRLLDYGLLYSISLGKILPGYNNGLVFYDRGPQCGTYYQSDRLIFRFDSGIDDRSPSSNNWRFLIACGYNMKGCNQGLGNNKIWAPSNSLISVEYRNFEVGYGPFNTEYFTERFGENEETLWSSYLQEQSATNKNYFIPTLEEIKLLYNYLQSNSASDFNISKNIDYFTSTNEGYNPRVFNFGDGSDKLVNADTKDCRARIFARV